MKNQLVADVLYEIADLLDIKGDIFFKVRAYRTAAQMIETLDEDIETVVHEQRLEAIPGVGAALAKKITEIVETGKLEYFEQLKKEIPEGLLVLLTIPSLGPKKVAAIYQHLGITTIDQLQQACKQGKLRELDGFGEITELNILRGISLMQKTSGRSLLNVAYRDGSTYLAFLRQCPEIRQVSIAGSLRRMKETIGDLDILASSDDPDVVMEYFVTYPEVQRVLLKGSTKTSVLLTDGVQVDLRVVKEDSYGSALQYFTGSKEHNVKMRGLAIKQGFKLSEYGLFDKETDHYIVGKTEVEVYNTLGLPYIEPELRENRGEVEAAQNKHLPDLVGYDDINGDFHVHSLWSDGSDSVATIAQYAQQLGYLFVGISDHSQSLRVANGLSEERLQKKINEIHKLNNKMKGIRILCGTECDIKSDGTLDYSNKILQQLDFVYIGIHSGFKTSQAEMTKRIISGMHNEHAHFLAHPTGRLIGKRDPFDVDIEQIIDTARDTGICLEINSFPDRLDLNDVNAKIAKEKGVKLVLGTDAHSITNLQFIRFGIATARRGWLEKKDIVNTYNLKDIETLLGG